MTHAQELAENIKDEYDIQAQLQAKLKQGDKISQGFDDLLKNIR